MRLLVASVLAVGCLNASAHALHALNDVASLNGGQYPTADATQSLGNSLLGARMRIMKRQNAAPSDNVQQKRGAVVKISTETTTVHRTVTITPTTTVPTRGAPPRSSVVLPPSSMNSTISLTDKILWSVTGPPATAEPTALPSQTKCLTMVGGCVVCPGDSMDTCTEPTPTTVNSMPSGACAAMDGDCGDGEATATGIIETTTSPGVILSAHTTTSTHSSAVTHMPTTTSSTVAHNPEATAMSPKDSAAWSIFGTAMALEKQVLDWLQPGRPANSPRPASEDALPLATLSQEVAAMSSHLKDLAALQTSVRSMVPPAPFPTASGLETGCHANSDGVMMLMVQPNHDEAQKPAATINEPLDTGKRIQLIDGKLTDKAGRHGFVGTNGTLQWVVNAGNQAQLSHFSVCGTEGHLALGQTMKWWRCEMNGGHDFVTQPRGDKCPKVWLALVPESAVPTGVAASTASTHTITVPLGTAFSNVGRPQPTPIGGPLAKRLAPRTFRTFSPLLHHPSSNVANRSIENTTVFPTELSSDGRCGPHGGVNKLCKGSQYGDCCNNGYCVSNPPECPDSPACEASSEHISGVCYTAKSGIYNHVPAHIIGDADRNTGISLDGKCGAPNGGKTCAGSKFGGCCGYDGTCGSDSAHCNGDRCSVIFSSGCTSTIHDWQRSFNWESEGLLLSKDGTCGRGNYPKSICASSPLRDQRQVSKFGHCCSQTGFCGMDEEHCAHLKCNPIYGQCNDMTAPEMSNDPSVVSTLQLHPYPPRSEADAQVVNQVERRDDGVVDLGLVDNPIPPASNPLSTDGTCGIQSPKQANCQTNDVAVMPPGSPQNQPYDSAFGACCSNSGFCGNAEEHCAYRNCQRGGQYGRCDDATWQERSNDPSVIESADCQPKRHEEALHEEVVDQIQTRGQTETALDTRADNGDTFPPVNTYAQLSLDGRCGVGSPLLTTCLDNSQLYMERGGSPVPSSFGTCCSNFGYCGNDEAHCGYLNCQRGGQYGNCSEPTWKELSNDPSVISAAAVVKPPIAQKEDEAVDTVTGTPVTVTATIADSTTDSAILDARPTTSIPNLGNAAGYIGASPSTATTSTNCTSTTSTRSWPMWNISTFIATGLKPLTVPTSLSGGHPKNTTLLITSSIPTQITTATGSPTDFGGPKPGATHTHKASGQPALPDAMPHAIAAVVGLLTCAMFAWRL